MQTFDREGKLIKCKPSQVASRMSSVYLSR